jgi:hypothetical protein
LLYEYSATGIASIWVDDFSYALALWALPEWNWLAGRLLGFYFAANTTGYRMTRREG